jgi:hypothetical protein
MVRKRVVKRVIRKRPDIDIKVRNVDKMVRAEKKRMAHHPSNFWIFGSILAIVLSYERASSILWAILHGILSWFYVLYRAMQIWGWF